MTESEYCAVHPDRHAIEVCEVCQKPLCGYCLYYTEDGQRLCEEHAQVAKANGMVIIPPAIYADGIIPSQAEADRHHNHDLTPSKGAIENNQPLYRGNNHDLNAFMSMGMGVMTLGTCCGAGCCFPFAGVLLGIFSLFNAKDAVEPKRARQQAWLGILTGGCVVAIMLIIIGSYIAIYGAVIASVNTFPANNPPANIIPTPTITVAPSQTPPPNIEPRQLTATARANDDQKLKPSQSSNPEVALPSLVPIRLETHSLSLP